MAKLAFIGLGALGAPIARHLAAAGHDLRLYTRTRAKAEAWIAAYGGAIADSPADAAHDRDAVFTCVGTDDDLAEVTLGRAGVFRTLRAGALFVDHTTVSARIARQLAVEGRDLGLLVLDAPVTGGESGARAGALSVMCGGTARAFAAAQPLIAHYARRIVHIGAAGAGQTAKMANQIAIAGIVQSLAEAVRFAEAAGLDLARVYEAIEDGAGSSWQMRHYWRTMAEGAFDHGLAVDWMRKDLGLAIDEARGNGAALPVAALVDQFFAEVQRMGGGRQDTSALVRRLPGGKAGQ
ncbi:NAD(P)-dependent oxidoreductase [Sphingomonas morindae]|uniref:NAD(P)-dependent oxidoreductase n=1 Tax=Sphingomonas morindae TaxID=1541170 RepID=A0ABY4X597_9SPHN|nr:NAD(P)-dependent oxidoreductase [Sphingomonas morindae]USI72031.1 NAD(P)-dependent oxidoreductase [Sphingomonas morindae]